jgi:hypothetical protein
MANEKQANKAREQHSGEFVRMGAHAIEVAPGGEFGKQGFVLVAHVTPKKKHFLPERVVTTMQGKKIEVEVIAKPSKPFKPE